MTASHASEAGSAMWAIKTGPCRRTSTNSSTSAMDRNGDARPKRAQGLGQGADETVIRCFVLDRFALPQKVVP